MPTPLFPKETELQSAAVADLLFSDRKSSLFVSCGPPSSALTKREDYSISQIVGAPTPRLMPIAPMRNLPANSSLHRQSFSHSTISAMVLVVGVGPTTNRVSDGHSTTELHQYSTNLVERAGVEPAATVL